MAKPPIKQESEYLKIPQSSVILASDPYSIINSLRTWTLWHARGRTLVIVENRRDVHAWIDHLWRLTRAVNVVAMVLMDPPEFYSWIPYQKDNCANVTKLIKLDITQLFSLEIKPPLHNCPIYAVTSLIAPTVIDNNNGIEPKIYLALADKIGLQPKYIDLPPFEYVWSLFDEENEPTNGLKLIFENVVDIMFSNMGKMMTDVPMFEYLPEHTMDSFHWFVPGPKVASTATAVFRSLSLQVWLAFFATTILFFLTILLFQFMDAHTFKPTLMITMGFILNLPISANSFTKLRVLAIIAYFYSVHITTAYQSGIILSLSEVPREKAIVDELDLGSSLYPILYHEGMKDLVEALSESPEYAPLCKPERINYTDYLHIEKIADPGDHALLGAKITFGSNIIEESYFDESGFPRVLMLKKPVTSSLLNFLISRGHPLKPLLSKYTYYLLEAGIPLQFEKQYRKLARPKVKRKTPFSVETVLGAFLLLLGLLFMCLIAFVLELTIHCYVNWNSFNKQKGLYKKEFQQILRANEFYEYK